MPANPISVDERFVQPLQFEVTETTNVTVQNLEANFDISPVATCISDTGMAIQLFNPGETFAPPQNSNMFLENLLPHLESMSTQTWDINSGGNQAKKPVGFNGVPVNSIATSIGFEDSTTLYNFNQPLSSPNPRFSWFYIPPPSCSK